MALTSGPLLTHAPRGLEKGPGFCSLVTGVTDKGDRPSAHRDTAKGCK